MNARPRPDMREAIVGNLKRYIATPRDLQTPVILWVERLRLPSNDCNAIVLRMIISFGAFINAVHDLLGLLAMGTQDW